ncbi:SCO family protein [Parazoarcus communis]|uniref:SCO family protein n=1 Tax=Parazoarcus communis SWub3 = DSM 12120 TaxID=1121029 RepID=A0A323UUF9_9RHOO|nr:SCO family protein [Parazoarcus communis]NMG71427.1 redoxin domain-containing protein [Parazoarcus communis SWub3 = DSM 12120]PZA15891.1 SCO family protein [Azoarcus communis] [Parazoarcus communis SWub3 = DSM 12120]
MFLSSVCANKLIRWVHACLLIGILGACDQAALQFNNTDITGASFGQDFSLLDPDGKTRTLADFRGKAVIVFFGFTQCPDVCPTALSRAVEVRSRLGEEGKRLQVIFVSVDPERDTPALLKEYTAAFDADFLGLYTSVEDTRKVAEAFRVFYRKVPTGDSYTMDHTATSYVYDPEGRLRLAVSHSSSAESVADDIRKLLQPRS